MKKKIFAIILTALTAAAIATAFVIIHKPVPKPEPLTLKPRIHLNDSLSNMLSSQKELEGLDKKIMGYMRQWQIKGASLAIMRNDSLLYAKGYGWAD
jgi:CubicO group peptidase (beta-lactamase class C family)